MRRTNITLRDLYQHESLGANAKPRADNHGMHLGAAIKHVRKRAKLNQLALARACGWESQSRISNYEKDVREPTLADLSHIAKACRTSVADIVRAAETQLESDLTDGRRLTQDELDLLDGYALLPDDMKTAVWSIIDGHIRTLDPRLSQLLGVRDVRRSKLAEPGLVVAQIVARAKARQPADSKSKRPRK
jgi:transcriptional regulator with XRE-family HTH domain